MNDLQEQIEDLRAQLEAMNQRTTMLEKVVFIDTEWMSETQKHAIGASSAQVIKFPGEV